MSNITYPNKTVAGSGGATYLEGNNLPAVELQADFDEIATKVNGELDEDNLRSGTAIPQSKLATFSADSVAASVIGDHSADRATALTQTTPGDSSTAASNLATDLEGEIERLRYRLHAQTGYRSSSQYRLADFTYENTNWTEPPIVGPNLIYNSGFEYHGGGSTDAPEGWTLVGTPSNVAIESAAHVTAGGHKRSLNIVTDATTEGIVQVIQGLKASTKYVFGVSYTVTDEGISMYTSGALSTGAYNNGILTDATEVATVNTLQLVVQTTTSAGDVTLGIIGSTDASDFNLHGTWFYELSDDRRADVPFIPHQVATHETAEDLPSTFDAGALDEWVWENVSELSLTQYIPGPGYRLVYEVDLVYTGQNGLVYTEPAGEFQQVAFRVQMDDGAGGGAEDVDGPKLIWHSTGAGNTNVSIGGTVSMKHIVDFPTPGLSYAFTVDVGAINVTGRDDQSILLSPLGTTPGSGSAVQAVSKARLIVERI